MNPSSVLRLVRIASPLLEANPAGPQPVETAAATGRCLPFAASRCLAPVRNPVGRQITALLAGAILLAGVISGRADTQTVTLQPGYNYVTCQVAGNPSNALGNPLFFDTTGWASADGDPTTVPNLLVLDPGTGTYRNFIFYDDGAGTSGWFDVATAEEVGSFLWSPGQGMIVSTPPGSAVTLTLTGTPLVAPVPKTLSPDCLYLLGSQVRGADTFDNITGHPAGDYGLVKVYRSAPGGTATAPGLPAGEWDLHTAIAGVWFPPFPALNAGEAVYLVTTTSSSSALHWTGTINDAWDINTTANWTADSLPAKYHDGDGAIFDDSATGTTTVNLTTALAPVGVIVDNDTQDYTFGGPGGIADAGSPTSLTKSGAGTLTLLTANTYTGGTTINAGTLQLGDGGTNGSVTGNIRNQGTLIWSRSNAMTYPGTISGTGTVVKNGTGSLTITGNNTYAGGTTINAGALQLGDGGTSGSITGNIANQGTLIWSRSNAMTYSGTISGTGTVVQTGTGTVTLTGNNTYTGDTTVNAGTLALVHAYLHDASTLTIASGAVVNLPHGATDIVGALVIGGMHMAAGTYGATGSGADFIDDTHFAGTGKIQTGPPSTAADILTFVFPGLPTTTIADTTISVTVPCGTDVTALAPTYTMSPGATGAPASGSTHDFTNPVHYLVTAQDGITTKDYTVTVTVGSTAPVTYAGLVHTAQGDATLCVQADHLTVSNLGTSGSDGVEVTMPAYATGWEADLEPLPIDAQDDSFLQMQIIGTASPVTDEVLGTTSVTKAGADDYVTSADFSPLGAASVLVEVYSGNNLVKQRTAAEASPGGGFFTNLLRALKWPTDIHAKLELWPVPPRMQWICTYPPNTGLVIDCEEVSGDRVVITPIMDSGVSEFSAVRILASQIPSITITSEDFTVAEIWSGLPNGDWDLGTTLNWTSGGSPATYTDGAAVLFDDAVTGTTTVNLTTALAPGMVTVENTALNYTFTGPGKLTGPTGLTKKGTGVLTLLTDNDYTGGTIINQGTLQLGDGGTRGSIPDINPILIGTLIWNRSDAVTFAGSISGTGGVTKAGTGTLTLTGVNTYSGPTTVSLGTLVVTGSLSASSTLTVAATGTMVLADNAGVNFVVGNASHNPIAGTGAVTLDGFCTIDTTAVTAAAGSWTLVDVATLAASFGPSFVVAGSDWSETDNVWTKLEGAKTWTFNEATGILSLTTVTDPILPVVTDFDRAAGTATLTFESRAAFIYDIEYSTTLTSWTFLESVLATSTLTKITDYFATPPQRFYRVSCRGPLTGALTPFEPPDDPPGQPDGPTQLAGAAWPSGEAAPSAQWTATRQPVPGTSPPGDAVPYLFSGEFHTTTTDLSIRGRGTDFVLTRTYRSKVGPATELGNGWDFSYNISVFPAQGSGFDVFNGNGRQDTYRLRPDGTYGADQLAHEGTFVNNTFTIKFADTGRWEFLPFDGSSPSQGKISKSIDRNGNTLTFLYDTTGRLETVVDTLGRNIQIGYNGDGLVQSVTDFAGRVVSYTYYQNGDTGGSAGDLKSVTWPAVTGTPNGNDFTTGKTVTYTYSTGFTDERLNHNLLTITDAKGQTWLRNTYATTTNPADPDFDKVLRQVRGNPDEVTTYCYTAASPTPANGFAVTKAIVNDATGNVTERLFDAWNRMVRLREFTGRAVPGVTTTEAQNRPTGKLRPWDPAFFETIQEWNADSRLTRTVFPDGSSVVNTYELDLNPAAPHRLRGNLREQKRLPGPAGGDQAALIESFVYDTGFGGGCCGSNFVTAATDACGNITRHTYDDHGNRLTTTHPITSIKEDFEYNAFGQMTAHVHPDRGDGYRRRDTFTYDGSGYLSQQVVDAAGLALTTAYEYDSAGNVTRIVDPRGHDTLYTVNSLNQLVRERSPIYATGSTVRYTKDFLYDANNNLVRGEVQNVDENGVLSATNPVFTTTHEYDILNALVRTTREVDPGHNVVTETAYDANRNPILMRYGQATSGADPFNTLTILYDERNLVFRDIRALGSPLQATTQSDYDANRNLIRTCAGLESTCPRITTATFDGYHRLTTTTDPMGNVTTSHYDPNGNLLSTRVDGELNDIPGSAVNIRLAETTHTYDAMNRQTRSDAAHFTPQTQAPIGDGQATTRTSYDGNSQVTAVQDDNGHITSIAYDTAGRPATKTDAKGNTVTSTYDADGNVVSTVEVDLSDLGRPTEQFTTTYTYDGLDRRIEVEDNVGNTSSYGYDSRSNRTKFVDAKAAETRYEFDGLNRLTRTIRDMDADGADPNDTDDIVTAQSWDDNSRLTDQSDDKGNATSYEYDSLNRLATTTYADETSTLTGYDVHDNRIQTADAVGNVVNYSYDTLNRLSAKTITPGAGVSGDTTYEDYQYDGLSRAIRAEDDDSVVTTSYDSLSNVARETLNGEITESNYDGLGNKLSRAYPGGRIVGYTYDALNRIATISEGPDSIASYAYSGPSRSERRDYGNGTRMVIEYDGIDNALGDSGVRKVVRTTHSRISGGAIIDDRSYTWNPTGAKTRREDLRATGPQLTHDYTYDAIDRLVHTTVTNNVAVEVRDTDYDLDGVGNRTTVTGPPDPVVYTMDGTTPEPADEPMNQYTTTPFDSRLYDKNSNLIMIDSGLPSQKSIAYDYRNQMVEVTDAATGQIHTYSYDPLGRRIQKVVDSGGTPQTTRYFYDNWQVVEEQNDTGATQATYVYGNYIDEVLTMQRGANDYYYHSDDLLNIMAVTDAAGNAVERYDYQDYGEPEFFNGTGTSIAGSAIANPYLFTGRRYDDESGLYYYRTRYLDPAAGRFVSRDTIGIWGDAANLGNTYSYVAGNPWTHIDPFGRGVYATEFVGEDSENEYQFKVRMQKEMRALFAPPPPPWKGYFSGGNFLERFTSGGTGGGSSGGTGGGGNCDRCFDGVCGNGLYCDPGGCKKHCLGIGGFRCCPSESVPKTTPGRFSSGECIL